MIALPQGFENWSAANRNIIRYRVWNLLYLGTNSQE